MIQEIELSQTKPSCEHCLSWSADGEIAVASGGYVTLLIPNRNRGQDGEGPAQVAHRPWNILKITVNEFDQSEWPLRSPLPTRLMSLGEEQSGSHIVALAWSSPGLAMYRRSVLAVLTANHLLSFWACVAHPHNQACWHRVLVVNYFLHSPRAAMDDQEPLPLRIRSFAWASFCEDNSGSMYTGPHLLAISDESQVIRIISVGRPTTSDRQASWFKDCYMINLQQHASWSGPPSLFRQDLNQWTFPTVLDFELLSSSSARSARLVCQCGQYRVEVTLEMSETWRPRSHKEQVISESPMHAENFSQDNIAWAAEIDAFKVQCTGISRRKPSLVDVYQRGLGRFDGIECTCLNWQLSNEIVYQSKPDETTTLMFRSRSGADLHDTVLPWQQELLVDEIATRIRILQTLVAALEKVADNTTRLQMMYSAIMSVIMDAKLWCPPILQCCAAILDQLEGRFQAKISFQPERKQLEALSEHLDQPRDPIPIQDRFAFVADRVSSFASTPATMNLLNQCYIPDCGSFITWAPFDEACCMTGHPLGPRCKITLLPILGIGISKVCSDCERTMLHEDKLNFPSLVDEAASNDGPSIDLARHLLETFDICPYCNGKYYTNLVSS